MCRCIQDFIWTLGESFSRSPGTCFFPSCFLMLTSLGELHSSLIPSDNTRDSREGETHLLETSATEEIWANAVIAFNYSGTSWTWGFLSFLSLVFFFYLLGLVWFGFVFTSGHFFDLKLYLVFYLSIEKGRNKDPLKSLIPLYLCCILF